VCNMQKRQRFGQHALSLSCSPGYPDSTLSGDRVPFTTRLSVRTRV
jgi:hypothetical protein